MDISRAITKALYALLWIGGSAAAQTPAVPPLAPQISRAPLEFRIVIPAVLQISQHVHPAMLPAGFRNEASERFEVLTTLAHGFCLTLQLSKLGPQNWQMQLEDDLQGLELHVGNQDYRLCASAPGRYTVVLRHRFEQPWGERPSPEMPWPVMLSLAQP